MNDKQSLQAATIQGDFGYKFSQLVRHARGRPQLELSEMAEMGDLLHGGHLEEAYVLAEGILRGFYGRTRHAVSGAMSQY